MSTPGWYPDPGGRSGHFRFWDGRTWAQTTTTDPRGAAAAPPGAGGPGPRRPRRGRLALVAVAVVAVLAVVAALAFRSADPAGVGSAPPTAVPSVPTPTAPPDDPSVTGPPSAVDTPTPSPGPSSDDTPGPTPSPSPCPVGSPFSRQDHPQDGRVHGGGVSFPQQPGWVAPGSQVSAFTWAYDVGETEVQVAPQRAVAYAVGAVLVADGFEDPQSAAELMMRCTAASSLYNDVTSRSDVESEETTVDGYRAWTLRSEIRTYDARTSYGADTVQITVVDLDSPESLAFFWGSAPVGDETSTARLDRVVRRLQVD